MTLSPSHHPTNEDPAKTPINNHHLISQYLTILNHRSLSRSQLHGFHTSCAVEALRMEQRFSLSAKYIASEEALNNNTASMDQSVSSHVSQTPVELLLHALKAKYSLSGHAIQSAATTNGSSSQHPPTSNTGTNFLLASLTSSYNSPVAQTHVDLHQSDAQQDDNDTDLSNTPPMHQQDTNVPSSTFTCPPTNTLAKDSQQKTLSKREQRKLQAYMKLFAQQENESQSANASSSSATTSATTPKSKKKKESSPKKKSSSLDMLADSATSNAESKKRKRNSSTGKGKKKKKLSSSQHEETQESDSDFDTDSDEIMPDPSLEDRVKLFSYVKQYLIDWKLDMNQPLAITPKLPAKIGKKRLLDSYLSTNAERVKQYRQSTTVKEEPQVAPNEPVSEEPYAIISEDDDELPQNLYDEEEEVVSAQKKRKRKMKKKSSSSSGGGGLLGIKIPKKKKPNRSSATPTSAVSMTPGSAAAPSHMSASPATETGGLTGPQQQHHPSTTTRVLLPTPPILAQDQDPIILLERWCHQHQYNLTFRTEKCPTGFRVRALIAGVLPPVFTPSWCASEMEARRKVAVSVVEQLWKMHSAGAEGGAGPGQQNTPAMSSAVHNVGNGAAQHGAPHHDPYAMEGGHRGAPPPGHRAMSPQQARGPPPPPYNDSPRGGAYPRPSSAHSGYSSMQPHGSEHSVNTRGGYPPHPENRRHYNDSGYSPTPTSRGGGGGYGGAEPPYHGTDRGYPDPRGGGAPPPPYGRTPDSSSVRGGPDSYAPPPRGGDYGPSDRRPHYGDSHGHMGGHGAPQRRNSPAPPPPQYGGPPPGGDRMHGGGGYPPAAGGDYGAPPRKDRDPYGRPYNSGGGRGSYPPRY